MHCHLVAIVAGLLTPSGGFYTCRYEPQEPNELPDSIASQYISTRFKTEEDVLAVAQACAASQLAKDPAVYSTLKDLFLARATITVRPTTRGRKDIDDWHPFARYKFITNKWLRDLQDTDYLWIKKAVDEGQLEITIDALHDEATCSSLRIDPVDMFWERLQKCYLTDFTSSDAGSAWNEVRRYSRTLAN
jgi:transcription elongation factor SPT6